jgi:C-terminal processing protease CtpA/Prc
MHLPIGETLLYPVVQWSIPDGKVLDGEGVVPDIEVALDRGLLLQGIDSQLEAAIDYVEGEAQEQAHFDFGIIREERNDGIQNLYGIGLAGYARGTGGVRRAGAATNANS